MKFAREFDHLSVPKTEETFLETRTLIGTIIPKGSKTTYIPVLGNSNNLPYLL